MKNNEWKKQQQNTNSKLSIFNFVNDPNAVKQFILQPKNQKI